MLTYDGMFKGRHIRYSYQVGVYQVVPGRKTVGLFIHLGVVTDKAKEG